MTDELQALAARVEALAGPCRETAHFVLYAAGWRVDAATSDVIRPDGSIHCGALPDPTASLDAAMTLVPSWCLPNLYYCPDEAGVVCEMRNSIGIPFKGYRAVSRADHPYCWSNALTAASLRARAAKEPEA